MIRQHELVEPRFSNPAGPPETRIYAVGDIHGRADLLHDMIERIEDDLARRPIARAVEVYIGDYIDRGPQSKNVIEMLAWRVAHGRAVCLRGNHEALLEVFLADPAGLHPWLYVGARSTLESYGLSDADLDASEFSIHRRLREVFPAPHRLFLGGLQNSFSCGDFLFVHAGIRPGVALAQQSPHDLLWIRDEFLHFQQSHGPVVVHGHTPVRHPELLPNRINIDTGAWMSGVLTCIAIEGTTITVL
ncbi:metallophosphoesterase [Afipia felis]